MLKELLAIEDTVPKGWKTAIEWAKLENLSHPSVLRYLRAGVEKGILEKKKFKVIRSGVVIPVPFYKLK